MKKIPYHISLYKLRFPAPTIVVDIILESNVDYQICNYRRLRMDDGVFIDWSWTNAKMAALPLNYIAKQLLLYPDCQAVRAVMRKHQPSAYIQTIQTLFASFRCGVDPIELHLKTWSYFRGTEWFEVDVLTIPMNRQVQEATSNCRRIHPLYGTLDNCLAPPTPTQETIDLTTWTPENPLDYEIIWHFQLELSNGVFHEMSVGICSARRWIHRVQAYFKAHPNSSHSPDILCLIMPDYHYETLLHRFEELAYKIRASSPEEVVLKLSSFLNFSQRAVYLQQILSHPPIELVFTGNVVWEEQ
jgi:hypothetical protein